MKNFLLISILLLSIGLIAHPEYVQDIPYDAAPIIQSTKVPGSAIKAGPTALFNKDGMFYSQVPSCMTSIIYDPTSGYIQTVATVYDSTLGEFDGLYYRASNDGGLTWSGPTKIMNGGLYQHNSFAINGAGYPYVAGVIRHTYRGVWFTIDFNGPNGGNWMSPVLLTDTLAYAAYYNQIAVNSTGDLVTVMAWDWSSSNWSYGNVYSTDYGNTWSTYSIPTVWDATDPSSPVYAYETSSQRWTSGTDVYAMMGCLWMEDSLMGPNFALSVSNDGGQTYSALRPAFDNNETWPAHPEVGNGDTLTYFIDTLSNGLVDSIPIKAWFDKIQNKWVDEIGNLDTFNISATGSWWHKWDFEYANNKLVASLPYYAITFDYIALATPDTVIDTTVTPNDTTIYEAKLYTFPDIWYSIVYGEMDIAAGDSTFNTMYIDLHNPIVDYKGTYPTILTGYVYSSSITYDTATDTVFIVYADGYNDTLGVFSTYMLKIFGNNVWLAQVIENNDMLLVESASILDADRVMHLTYSTQADDSVYYLGIDVDTISTWTQIKSGINVEKNVYNINKGELFNVPSLIRGTGEISFALNNNSNVKISLFDITGREVMTLVNREFAAGNHTVSINADKLTQGVYFANIKTDIRSDSKKVIIIK